MPTPYLPPPTGPTPENIEYSDPSPYSNLPFVPVDHLDHQNFSLISRGVFSLNYIRKIDLYSTKFSLPGISTEAATMETPFVKMKFSGDKLFFDKLQVEFLVREDLTNWEVLKDWIFTQTFPNTYREHKDRKLSYADSTLHVFNNRNNIIKQFVFRNLFPVALGPLEFSMDDQDATPMKCTVTFEFDSWQVSGVDDTNV